MDDLMYALDGLSAKLPASTQQESAIAIAETSLTQRGRMALRSASHLQAVAARLMWRLACGALQCIVCTCHGAILSSICTP